MVLNGIKAIFFDLDNTLIDTSGASKKAIEECFQSVTLDQEAKGDHLRSVVYFSDFFSASSGIGQVIKLLKDKSQFKEDEIHIICNRFQAQLLHETFDPSEMTIDDLRVLHWEKSMQEIKPGDYKDLAQESYALWKTKRLQLMTLSESAKNMLCELRKSVRLVLLTNGERQVQREKIEACGVSALFDAIVVGGEHSEEKPAPSIFLHCCDLVSVKPEDCVMVGDNLDTDIQGGLNAGLKATIWLNKNPQINSNPSPTPHYTIHSMNALPEVLQNVQ